MVVQKKGNLAKQASIVHNGPVQPISETDHDFVFLMPDKKKQVAILNKPFDSKKNIFVPLENGGFAEATVVSQSGDNVTVKLENGNEITAKADALQQMNPPKFDKINDMATLTCLNEASVLHNLTQRYYASLIYTYSGLFLVAINPYRRLPIYEAPVIAYFKGRRRNEVPPHLFAVSDTAYQAMLQDKDNQSLLITGESGAGKTENTKKVIHYYAAIAASKSKSDGNLENQIIQANPVLEAYGNAKTIRNNNSSRFGKFIRIHFGPNGKIAGADVETYLLEKSRVINQQANERNFHIFYQLLSDAVPQYCKDLLVEANPSKYQFINQGTTKIESMDDREEFQLTETAFDTLGFSHEEKMDLYKCTAAVCIFGNAKWKQRPREEQAEIDGLEEIGKVAYLLGVNENDLVKGLLKPRIKVGNDFVQKGQNKDQVTYAVGALSKSIYERLFKWLVSRINKTLDSSARRQNFIGVLDIAGFEIFKFNSFEQLCINYTNECLQQFFNHHMFVLEQEEYRIEGIKWQFIDFGMDLQACIDLIEKPMGILSILEEECMFPKASDKSFVEKLIAQHDGKSPNFHQIRQTAKSGDKAAHFEVVHYAGTVPYNASQWLEKNMDPVNETVVNSVFTQSNQSLMKLLYSKEAETDDTSPRKGKKKTGSRQTISSVHRFQLNNLMATLKNTSPHFVRCIIPNEKKSPEMIDAGLVLHQLKCNGVLEGIRICRKGFPNRIPYAEFKQRYTILDPTVVPKKGFVEPRKLCEDLLKSVDLPEDNYRYGQTKIFFRAGVVAELEDLRDTALTRLMIGLQCWIRGYNTRQKYKKLLDQMVALGCLQRNIRSYLGLKKWPWWHLYTRIKPLLFSARMEEQYKEVCAELAIAKENLEKGEKLKKEAEETNLRIIQEKNELLLQLQAEKAACEDSDSRCQMLITQKGDLEGQLQEIEERLMDEEDANTSLSNNLKKMEHESEELKRDIEELEQSLAKADQERINKENQMKSFQDEMTSQDDIIGKLNREKKILEDANKKLTEELQNEEDKLNHINKLKTKLDGTLDDVEDKLEKEKKARGDLDKVKRKLETELKQTNSMVEDLERMKKDLEETVRRKDVEANDIMMKFEGEQVAGAQINKKVKEQTARLEELEEELEMEKQNRMRAEKQRADLAHELDDLTDKLDEAGGQTVAQSEVSKKQEQELIRMRHELEEANMNHDAGISSMKKKHQDIIAEMADQIDQMQKMKNKNEKDKSSLQMEHDELLHDLSQTDKAKQTAEKLSKQLEAQLSESNVKLEESSRNVSELASIKQKLQNENNDLLKSLEEAEHHVSALTKQKQQLTIQLDDTKRNVDDETQTKNSVANNLKKAHADLDALKEQLEEEMESKSELQRNLSKANTDIQMWKAKYEQEGLARTEELEESKKRLAAKLVEAEEQLEATLSKCSSLEKAKSRMGGEIEDLTIDVERANATIVTLDKKQKQFDKAIADWKMKHDELLGELEFTQKDARGLSTEVLNLKAHLEESTEQGNMLQRENKKLMDENSDLADQLGEGGRSVHELDKARRQLESDKEELLSALEEAETALEQEEAKMVRAQLELSQIRQDVDRRLAEKEEEFENTRKNHARAMDSMQASLEGEQRSKQEMLRLKKKLESDINELEVTLDNVNRSNSESIKQIKKLTTETRDLQTLLDEEKKVNEELKDAQSNFERKVIGLNSEVSELQATLDSAERAKKAVEMELQDSLDRIQELTVQVSSLSNTKRKLEQDIQAMHADLDDAMNEFRNADERAKKAAGDATAMAEELKREQDHSLGIEKQRKSLEQMIRDLQVRLEEAEATALKGGKKIIAKLEDRVRELESDLDVEQRRHSETSKNLRKTDRRLKELSVQTEDDRKNMERMQETIDKHQAKLKTFKRQVEEAEEVASMNLSKFRKVQQDLEEAEERADVAESTLAKVRAKNRSTVSTTRLQTPSLQHTRLSMPPQSGKPNGEVE